MVHAIEDLTGSASSGRGRDDELGRPPPTSDILYDFFAGEGLARGSSHGALVHMASVGASSARGVPDPEAALVGKGVVGVRGERSKASRYRETARLLAELDQAALEVLRLAYGPQDQVPALKLSFDPEARARVDGPGADNDGVRLGRLRRASKTHQERFGGWRQVLTLTKAALSTTPAGMSVATWIATRAPKDVLTAARVEANTLVREAWAAWQAVRRANRRFGPKGGAR